MTKKDFLLQLRRSLSGKLGSAEISEIAAYYEEYIEIQVRKGQDEQQVTELLGDPALLVKSILNAKHDKKYHFDGVTFFSLGTRIKSVCKDLGDKFGAQAKRWMEKFFS